VRGLGDNDYYSGNMGDMLKRLQEKAKYNEFKDLKPIFSLTLYEDQLNAWLERVESL